ncbi:MAG: lysophospholipid acyltransferase family protein [Selenomonadaceae bacterium]
MKFFSQICCLLPKSLCLCLGEFLGQVTWGLVPARRKRMAIDNVRKCLALTEIEAKRIAKKSWTRFGYMIIEVLRFPLMKNHITDYVRIEGREHMEKALALGRGGIIATAHSGNWELLGGALALSGFPIVGVAQKQTNEAMNKFINEYRRMVGMHITYKTGVREMITMLADGWVIGLLMDQRTNPRDGVILKFFGRDTPCVPGPASLARFKNAPILPVFITQEADGKHLLKIYEPVFVEKTKDKHEDIKRTTAVLTQMIETHIREYPEEWFWLHDRWDSA